MITTYVYQMAIFDAATGIIQAVIPIDSVKEVRYSRVLNGIGKIAVTFPSDTIFASAFLLDNFLEVYRTDPITEDLAKEETFLIRIIERMIDEGEEWIVIGGMSLNHLLTRRVIDPDDDPLVAGGYTTKAGLADQVISQYVNEQMGPGSSSGRQIPNLTIKPPTNVGTPLGARLQHEKLYNEIRRMALQSGVDIYIERTTYNNMIFAAEPIGVDRSYTTNYPGHPWVGFSIKRGNAESFEYSLDRAEDLNFAYALGPGNVGDRIVLKVPGQGVGDSPFNRGEFVQDARNIEKGDALGLLSEAQGALVEKRYKEVYNFNPLIGVPGSVYHLDWDLGDRVSGILDSTIVAQEIIDFRITEIEVNISEGVETINVTATTQWKEAEGF